MNLDEYKKIKTNIYLKEDRTRGAIRAKIEGKIYTKSIETNPKMRLNDIVSNLEAELIKLKKSKQDKKTSITLNEMFAETQANHPTKWYKTAHYKYNKFARDNIGKKNIADIKKSDIEKILLSMRDEGKSEATRKEFLNVLSPIFQRAIEKEYIQVNPIKLIKLIVKRKPKVVTNATQKWLDLKKVIEETYSENPYYKSIFLFALYGRRKQEILKMEWKNIDLENSYYWIEKTKTDKSQKFKLPEEIKEELKKIKAVSDYVYNNPDNPFKPIADIRRQIIKIKKLSKIENFNLHYCRNILVSMLAEQGVEGIYLSAILGHSDINTVNIYLSQNNVKGSEIAIEKINELQRQKS